MSSQTAYREAQLVRRRLGAIWLRCTSLGDCSQPDIPLPDSMARLWRGYLRLLRDYTLPTQMASGATLMSTGDAISQHAIERKPLSAHDWGRTGRFAYYSAFGCVEPEVVCHRAVADPRYTPLSPLTLNRFNPIANRWHTWLNSIVLSRFWPTVAARVAIDMVGFAPGAVVFFFVYNVRHPRLRIADGTRVFCKGNVGPRSPIDFERSVALAVTSLTWAVVCDRILSQCAGTSPCAGCVRAHCSGLDLADERRSSVQRKC